jgi:plastocyanin
MMPALNFQTGRVAAVVIAVAFGLTAQSHAAQDANVIVMKNFEFSPMSITVRVGSTVTWQNRDGEPHTVVGVDGAFRSGALDQDEKFAFTFHKRGNYRYTCAIHPRMVGTVVVK